MADGREEREEEKKRREWDEREDRLNRLDRGQLDRDSFSHERREEGEPERGGS